MQNTKTESTQTFRYITMFGREWKVSITDTHTRYGERRYFWKKGGYVEPTTKVFFNADDSFDALATAKAPEPVGGMFPHLAMYYGSGDLIGADDYAWTQRGEYPEVDKAWDRYNRALVKGWGNVMREVADLTGVDTFRYSRYAGCTCPCSSGFIAKSGRNAKGTTITVSVEPA